MLFGVLYGIPAAAKTYNYGDVLVVNDDYARYKGERQIVKQPTENDGRRNLVGHLSKSLENSLQYVKP